MTRLPWILGLGGGAAALYAWSRGRSTTPSSTLIAAELPMGSREPVAPMTLAGSWAWPVPSWQGRSPIVSDGFYSPRPGYPRHGGADLMFARLPGDAYKAGTPNATKRFVMPDGLAALAASDGVVWTAEKTPQGFAVVIDHGKRGAYPVSTFYTHLERLLVAPKQRVTVGQPIGVIGFSPLDPEKIKHLHFEVRLGGATDRVDPEPLLRAWPVLSARPMTPSSSDPPLLARNATTPYRPLGESGDRYPEWVRSLKGRSGVYLIRDRRSRELLYVGSSARRLYETLTRHFQRWRRFKGFWAGQYAEGHDPGLTYDRADVEVAIHFTNPDASLDIEARLIHRIQPRDNLLGQPADDEAPFDPRTTMNYDFDIATLDPHPAFRPEARHRARPRHPARYGDPVWPLPAIDGVSPSISESGERSVSVSYDASVQPPTFVPVFAVREGTIAYAGAATDEHAIVIEHRDEQRSFYWGLSHAFVFASNRHPRTQRVNAGDVLGYVCRAPARALSLHFGLMKPDGSGHLKFLDPSTVMRAWFVLTLADDRTTPPTAQPLAA